MLATPQTGADPPRSTSGNDLPLNEAQSNIDFFNAAQQLSIGTVTTTIVSGDCTYNVTVVNHNNSRNSQSNEETEVPLHEIVSWLQGPKFLRIYEEALSQRLPNTGLWFIESPEFRQLVEGKDIVVWGTGMPGAGKTVVSSFSFERLKEIFEGHEGVAIVGAYIRYTERLPLRDIFAGLLTQLVEDHPCACNYMRHIYVRKQREDLNTVDMVKALQYIVSMLSKVFVIIDGLDEADDLVKDELLQALPFLGANVLITSRPLELYYPRISNALHIHIEARTEDIDHFVEEKVKSSSMLQAILSSKPALTKELKKRVRESSKGMFLVAQLQMEGVIVKARSVSTLWKALKQLPSGVDAMHEHTLKRINDQTFEDASIAHRVFIWMLYSARELSVHELQDALTVSFESKAYDSDNVIPVPIILSMCGGFVTVAEHGQKPFDGTCSSDAVSRPYLRFIHYTTHEFLKTVQFPNLPSPRMYMAVTCAVYLREHWHRQVEHPLHGAGADGGSDEDSNPFFKYADQYWEMHTGTLESEGPLDQFLQSFIASRTSRLDVPQAPNTIMESPRKLSQQESAQGRRLTPDSGAAVGRETLATNSEENHPKHQSRMRDIRRLRPPSSYIFFQKDIGKKLSAQFPDLTNPALLAMIYEKWTKMTEEEKQPYNQQMLAAKADYTEKKFAHDNRTAERVEADNKVAAEAAAEAVAGSRGGRQEEVRRHSGVGGQPPQHGSSIPNSAQVGSSSSIRDHLPSPASFAQRFIGPSSRFSAHPSHSMSERLKSRAHRNDDISSDPRRLGPPCIHADRLYIGFCVH